MTYLEEDKSEREFLESLDYEKVPNYWQVTQQALLNQGRYYVGIDFKECVFLDQAYDWLKNEEEKWRGEMKD